MSFVVVHSFLTADGLYYVQADFTSELIRLSGPDPAPVPGPTEAEFNFNWGDVINQRCSGTTLQRIVAQENYPYAIFSNVLNSPDCGVVLTQTTQNLAAGTFSGLIYRGTFVNIETTRPDNANIQQICTLDIYDTEYDNHSTFNTQYLVKDNGDGTQTVYISWSTLPDAATSASVGYSANGVDWTDIIVGRDSPVAVIIPTGEYFYSLILDYPGDTDPRYLIPVPTIIPLEMTDRPVMISVIDNDEDAFTPVRSKSLDAEIYSGNGIDISTFAQGGDQRYYVEYFVAAQIKFKGWLSISDLSQDFMPDPNVINLVATDGLGFLSDIPLTDFEGNNPQNENQIMDYLAWSLSKTGLHLDIVVCMNIRERFSTPLISDDSGDGHFYKWEWLDAKTFEKEIGVSEDCRTALEKILKEGCSCYQDNGTWFIMRKDEFEQGRQCYLFKFDWQGTFIEATQEVFEKSIGVDLPMAWMNDDAQILLERPFKSLKETYKYATPQEMICNIDFTRGDESIDQWLVNYTLYDIDCWTTSRNWGANEVAPNTTAHIARSFDTNDQENQRFIVIKMPATETNPQTYIRSEPVPINILDKFKWSFDYSATEDNDIADSFILGIALTVLYGEDGSVWTLEDGITEGDPPSWHLSNAEISIFRSEHEWDLNPGGDSELTEWRTFSVEAPPAPVAGNLVFYLYAANRVSALADNFHIRYSNLSFEYFANINGSYKKLAGQYNKIEQSITTVAVRDNEVFISDSPGRLYKGALLKQATPPNFTLANRFYDGAKYPNADFPDESYVHPFGWLQAFDVWNQINRLMRKFDGTVDGMQTNTEMPDLKYQYFLTDVNANTDNKIFMLVHFEQNHHTCEWNGFLTEVADSTVEKVYTGNTFKYITGDK